MPVHCVTCGTPMKPLFYMHSLFCPKECDLKAKTAWISRSDISYVFQVIPPGVPYPDDAGRGHLLPSTISTAIEAEASTLRLVKACSDNLWGWIVDEDERAARYSKEEFQYHRWAVMLKRK